MGWLDLAANLVEEEKEKKRKGKERKGTEKKEAMAVIT